MGLHDTFFFSLHLGRAQLCPLKLGCFLILLCMDTWDCVMQTTLAILKGTGIKLVTHHQKEEQVCSLLFNLPPIRLDRVICL